MVILQLEEQPPLIQAVFAGKIEQARNLLEHKEDVNYQDYEKRSALHAAAFRGDAEMTKLLIDHGARVNTKDSKWLTPLHRACSSGSEETVSILLNHSADTSARDRQWQTPLHIAAAYNALECISCLLDKVPNPNVTDRSGRTALHHAVLNGHNDIVELLILQGCVVNACDKKDCRPIHWAAQAGHIDTIELLLRHGADINARDRNLYMPLHVAAASGMVSACRILLAYGADVDSQNAYGNTPLHIACLNGHLSVCQELVSNGCDKEALNYRGQTPLHIAAASTHGVQCLNYLVCLRVNINKQSLDGRTPLHMTAIHGRFTRSKTLIDQGAIVDCVDKNGCTALHIAAQHGHELLSNTLLSYGADASKKGHEGRTALHMCCLSGYVECCRTFMKAGVDINAQDDSGKTPTHCASYKGSVECLDLLVSNGADFKVLDNIGRTALHYAAVQGYFDCVFTLVGIGSSVNQTDNEGCTALHLAAAYDLEGRCVDYLIQHKADSRLKDKNGFTPVHYAVAGNNVCGLRYLLDSCGSSYLLFGHDMPLTTPLHLAAKNGNMEILEKLMPYFPDPSIKTEHGCTPLLLAAREGFANCVQLLLRFGAKVSVCDSVYNMTPIHHSAKNGHVHCLALLVDNAEDKSVIDLPDKLQRTALMLAVSNSHNDCVLTLIKSGADPNIVDNDFHSCLFRSVVTGQHSILQMLLPRSSTINKQDVNGKTVLHIAAACGRVTCLQRILHYMDRNVAASQDNQNCTALHWACYSGSAACVEHLLKEGIFKELEGNPFSAVHCATSAGSEKCLTILCTYFSADIVKLRDKRNRTPLHIAALHGRMECALYLLQQGAEIECQDEDGRTPLIAAAQNGQVQVIEVLIGYKADMTSFDKNGNTALHLACLQKHNHAALLLLEYTADPNIINMGNNDRKTPLHLSARNGLVDVTRQLILKGSSVLAVDSNGLTPALCCAPNPSVAQCLAIILSSYPGLTTNNKKALLNPELFKTNEKSSADSQTEISLLKNPDQFELEQMFKVKFQPDSDLKYSKDELLCLTSSIVQNFFEGKQSKKKRRKIVNDTKCFILENCDANDHSFAEKPTYFGRDLHKSQSDMTLTNKTIYSEEDYGRIIQSARSKECKEKKTIMSYPQSESRRLGGDSGKRKPLRKLQEPEGEFIMKKFLESTEMQQSEDVRYPPRQLFKLKRKVEGCNEQNQTRSRNYLLNLNKRPSANTFYQDMASQSCTGCALQEPCVEINVETTKRRVTNKGRGGSKPKQKTSEAKDGVRLRSKKNNKVEETLTTISCYCDHILETVKAEDYTMCISKVTSSHLRNASTIKCNDLQSDLSVTTFIEGSKIDKCGENPLLTKDSKNQIRHMDAELTTIKNITKKQSKKKTELKNFSSIHVSPMYINDNKPRCYPTFWCFPEINKQPQDSHNLRSSSNQNAMSENSNSSRANTAQGVNSPNSQGDEDSQRTNSNRTSVWLEANVVVSSNTSGPNRVHRDSPNSASTDANSNYIQSQGSDFCYSFSPRAVFELNDKFSPVFKESDSPSTRCGDVNSKYRLPNIFEFRGTCETNARVDPNANALSVDGANAEISRASFEMKVAPSLENGTDLEKLRASFEANVGVSSTFKGARDFPNVRNTCVNSKPGDFELCENSKKFGPFKIDGNSRCNGRRTYDSPDGRNATSNSNVYDSHSFELGENSKKSQTSPNQSAHENSCGSCEAQDSPLLNSTICDSSSSELEGNLWLHRARVRHGFETGAGTFPNVSFLKTDSSETRNATVTTTSFKSRDYCDSVESNLAPTIFRVSPASLEPGGKSKARIFPDFTVDGNSDNAQYYSPDGRNYVADPYLFQSRENGGYSPAYEIGESSGSNVNCVEMNANLKIEENKEDENLEQSKLAADRKLKFEMNKRLRSQVEEEYGKRKTSSEPLHKTKDSTKQTSEWRDVTYLLDLFQAGEAKTDYVTQLIESYALCLQRLAAQFDCLTQDPSLFKDIILRMLAVHPEADCAEDDLSPNNFSTFENDIKLIEYLYNKRDEPARRPEEIAQLDQEILGLGRKIILQYFNTSMRGKPPQQLLEKCPKKLFEYEIVEEQLQKEANFMSPQTSPESLRGNEKTEVFEEQLQKEASFTFPRDSLREDETIEVLEEQLQTTQENLRGTEDLEVLSNKETETQSEGAVSITVCCQTSRAKNENEINEESCQTTQEEYGPETLMDMIDDLYEKRNGMPRGNEDIEALDKQISELEMKIIRKSSAKHKLRELMRDYKSSQTKIKNDRSNAELRKLIREMIVEEKEKEEALRILYDQKGHVENGEESCNSKRFPPNIKKLDTLKESADFHMKKESPEHVINWKLYMAHRNLVEFNNNEERLRNLTEEYISKKQAATMKKKKFKPEFRIERTQSEKERATCKLKESKYDKHLKIEVSESLVKIDELIREGDPKPRKIDFFENVGFSKTDAEEKKEESGRGQLLSQKGGKGATVDDLLSRVKPNWVDGNAESDWIAKSQWVTEEIVGAQVIIQENEAEFGDFEQTEVNGQLQVEDIEENQQRMNSSRGFIEESKLGIENTKENRGAIEKNRQRIENTEENEVHTDNREFKIITVSRSTKLQIEEDEENEQDLNKENKSQVENIEEIELLGETMTTSRAAKSNSRDLTKENKLQVEEEQGKRGQQIKAFQGFTEESKLQLEEPVLQIEETKMQSVGNLHDADTQSAIEEIELHFEELCEENQLQIEDVELQVEETEENELWNEDNTESEPPVEETTDLQVEHVIEENEEAMTWNVLASEIVEGIQGMMRVNEDTLTTDELQIEESLSTEEGNGLQVEGIQKESASSYCGTASVQDAASLSVTETQDEETQSATEDNLLQSENDGETQPQNVIKLRIEETRAVSELADEKQPQDVSQKSVSSLQLEDTRANKDSEENQLRSLAKVISVNFTTLRIEEIQAPLEVTNEKQRQDVTQESVTRLQLEKTRANEDIQENQLGRITEATSSSPAMLQIQATRAVREVSDEKQLQDVARESVTGLQLEETRADEYDEENSLRNLTEATSLNLTTPRMEEIRSVSEVSDEKQLQNVIEESVTRLQLEEIEANEAFEKNQLRDIPETTSLSVTTLLIEENQAESETSEDTDQKKSEGVTEEIAPSFTTLLVSETDKEITEENTTRLHIEETRNKEQWLQGLTEEIPSNRPELQIEEPQVAVECPNEEETRKLRIEETWTASVDTDDCVTEERLRIEQTQDSKEERPQPSLTKSQTEETLAVSSKKQPQRVVIAESFSVIEEQSRNKDAQDVEADEKIMDEARDLQLLGVIEENVNTNMSCAMQLQTEDNVLSECTDISDGGQDKSDEYHDLIDLEGIADIQNELLDNVFYDAQSKVEETTDVHKEGDSKSEITPPQLEKKKSEELKAPKIKRSFPSLSKLGKKAKKDSNCKIS